jgi:hypothetical protein
VAQEGKYMIVQLNRIAKAIVAWAVPTAVVLTSLGSEVVNATEDGFISGAEWQILVIAVITGVLTYFKANAPPAPSE